MKLILNYLLILVALTGCSSPISRPVEVDVPIAVACRHPQVSAPQWNMENLAAAASDADRLKAALADLELSRGYMEELMAALAACD